MGLVEYQSSSSDDEGDNDAVALQQQPPPAKRRKLSAGEDLPPLPSNFRDLYSSTVRASTQDDPSLHGGRKRVTPHVVGNWPAHVFLEWTPKRDQQIFLADLISNIQDSSTLSIEREKNKDDEKKKEAIHTLFETELGVPLPLHVSLSRPLSLKTAEKDHFLKDLTSAITATNIRNFEVCPKRLTWHPNEDRTRWFLVMSLQRPEKDELRSLLGLCNRIAGEYRQPLLYQESKNGEMEDGKFHLSVAWSLMPQKGEVEISGEMREKLQGMKIDFGEVKVRIGQDVTSVPLRKRRGALFGSEA